LRAVAVNRLLAEEHQVGFFFAHHGVQELDEDTRKGRADGPMSGKERKREEEREKKRGKV